LRGVAVVEELRGREGPELVQQVTRMMGAGTWPTERRGLYDAHGDGHRREAARAVAGTFTFRMALSRRKASRSISGDAVSAEACSGGGGRRITRVVDVGVG
jgi:hypothetical protein